MMQPAPTITAGKRRRASAQADARLAEHLDAVVAAHEGDGASPGSSPTSVTGLPSAASPVHSTW